MQLQPVPNARRVGVISHQSAPRHVQGEPIDLGTPETRKAMEKGKRMVKDSMLGMYERELIDQDQYNAGVMIATGWRFITIGMDAQIATYGTRIPGGDGDSPSEYATILIRQYHAWIKEVQDREQAAGRFMHGARRSRVPAITDVIIHGLTCNHVEGCRRLRKGSLIGFVRDALDVYTDIRFLRGKWAIKRAA